MTYAHDLDGELVSQSDPNPTTGAAGGPTTSYTYDAMGNMLSLTNPDGNTTSWTYDGLGRRVQQSASVALGYKPGTTNSLRTATAVCNINTTSTATLAGYSVRGGWRVES